MLFLFIPIIYPPPHCQAFFKICWKNFGFVVFKDLLKMQGKLFSYLKKIIAGKTLKHNTSLLCLRKLIYKDFLCALSKVLHIYN